MKGNELGISLRTHLLSRVAIEFVMIRDNNFFYFSLIAFSFNSRSSRLFLELSSLSSFLWQIIVADLLILYIMNTKNCNVHLITHQS